MGGAHSVEERQNLKEEIYAYWPGLEQQLEMAFTCHDLNKEGKIPLDVCEQIVRHLLMQYGLIEYVARFCTESTGQLDVKHVTKDVKDFRISLSIFGENNLSLVDFKSYAVVWLKKMLDTFKQDQVEWAEKLRADQEKQNDAYRGALEKFQTNLSQQQLVYKQGMLEQQKQILEWNKLLEETQKTQKEIYDIECTRIEELKKKEENKQAILEKQERDLIKQYQIELSRATDGEPKEGITYVYPASSTPYGACASAGAQEPLRRKYTPKGRPEHAKGIRAMC